MQRLTEVTCETCETNFIMRADESEEGELCCPRCGNIAVPENDEEDEDDE